MYLSDNSWISVDIHGYAWKSMDIMDVHHHYPPRSDALPQRGMKSDIICSQKHVAQCPCIALIWAAARAPGLRGPIPYGTLTGLLRDKGK